MKLLYSNTTQRRAKVIVVENKRYDELTRYHFDGATRRSFEGLKN